MTVTVTLTILFGLLGMAVGSFLNVCIDRLPARKSLAYPPSRCDVCGHPLAVKDLFPVFSYLWLRGKCRYCGARIPRRVPLVEFAAGVLFAFLFWDYGFTYEFPLVAFYSCVLLVLAVIDLHHKLILNVIVYPVAVIALAISFFLPGTDWWRGLAGGAIGFAILELPALVSPRGMGMGDVKMAAMIGLMAGFPRVFVAVLGGIVLGALVALVLLVMKKRGRKDGIPFGPFLALGGFAALVWGDRLLALYLGLFQP